MSLDLGTHSTWVSKRYYLTPSRQLRRLQPSTEKRKPHVGPHVYQAEPACNERAAVKVKA